MDKGLELYLEEQRDSNKKLIESIKVLVTKVDEQIKQYKEPIYKVNIPQKVEVNTEKEVAISNLEDVKEYLESLGDVLTKQLEKTSYEPLESVTVKNIKDAIPKELSISNLNSMQIYFDSVIKAIEANRPIVEVTKQDMVFPRTPSEAIPVRLSDGKRFYKAMATLASAVDSKIANLYLDGTPVSSSNPVPVDIQDASVTINGDVTVSSEVEVKNDTGNPVPVSASSLPLPTGASTLAEQQTQTTHLSDIKTSVQTLDNAISGNEMQVDIVSAPTLTVNSHAVTNAGVFAVQESKTLTPYFDSDGDNTAQTMKGSAGNLYFLEVSNPNASDAYIQLFDESGSITVGTTTPKLSFLVPAGDGTKDGAMDKVFTIPIAFANSIKYACTTTATGSTDPTTGLIVNGGYI